MTVTALPGRERSEVLQDGIVAHYITSPDHPMLERFYAAYDAAFILPDEKEHLEGFKACLALNEGAAYTHLSGLYGPYREIIILLTRGADGPVLGAANFIAFAGDGTDPTVSLSYIFTDGAHRGQGLFGLLLGLARREAVDAFNWPAGAPPDPLIFIEVNDPQKMTPEAYALDSRHSGLDQVERLKIWDRRGAKLIDIAYHQPPLSPTQDGDDTLLIGVLGSSGPSLTACQLFAHMRRFFAVTVLKGDDPEINPIAASELAKLEAACARGETIRLTDFSSVLNAVDGSKAENGPPAGRATPGKPDTKAGQ